MKIRMISAVVLTVALAVLLPGDALASVITKEFAAGTGQRLEIDLETGGSVTVNAGAANKVTVEARLKGRDADAIDFRAEATSGGVLLRSEYRGSERNRSGSVDLTITVPPRFDIEIETMGGGISIDGVEGSIEGSTMGGPLELRNLKGSVNMSTMGGSIVLQSSRVDGEVSTMGGRVELRDVEGDIRGRSMGGNVIYENVRPARGGSGEKPLEISTMGGDIEVPSAPAGAMVSTMGGDIEVRSAAKFVKAKTMGGDIRIREVDGWVEATTMGGTIEVRVTGSGKERHVDLDSKGGDIILELPADFPMDVDIEVTHGRRGVDRTSIRSDFAIRVDDTASSRGWGPASVRGTGSVNGGGNKVRIRTIDGTVTLRKK
jgi:DUF4097 and DUF4098 domain-containing protein YvlB